MTELSLDPAASVLPDVQTAADAALAVLPSPHLLRLGSPGRDSRSVEVIGVAVRARFSGSTSGTVVIAVDDSLTQALATSPMGAMSPAQALQPALEAAVRTVGPVRLGPVEVCEVRSGLDEVVRDGGAVVPLLSAQGVHAVVGLAMEPPLTSSARPSSSPLVGGLDMLRGVEMEVSAELGRARMSLDELLNLGDGAVIELDRAAGAPADLLVNGRLIARGEVVVVDENFGLRITEIITDAAGR